MTKCPGLQPENIGRPGLYADVVELADMLDLGSSAQACRFKSCHPHQSRKSTRKGAFSANRRQHTAKRCARAGKFRLMGTRKGAFSANRRQHTAKRCARAGKFRLMGTRKGAFSANRRQHTAKRCARAGKFRLMGHLLIESVLSKGGFSLPKRAWYLATWRFLGS